MARLVFQLFIILFYFFEFTVYNKVIGEWVSWFSPIFFYIPLFFIFISFSKVNFKLLQEKEFGWIIVLFLTAGIIDASLSIYGALNYLLYFIKGVLLILLLMSANRVFIFPKEELYKSLLFIYNLYLFAGIAILLSLIIIGNFDSDFLGTDMYIFKKNVEGWSDMNFYSFPLSLGLVITGDTNASIGSFYFPRYCGFHHEPAKLAYYFIPLTILFWKRIKVYSKVIAVIIIVWAFSATSIIALVIVYTMANMKDKSWIKKTFAISLVSLGLLYYTWIFSNTSLLAKFSFGGNSLQSTLEFLFGFTLSIGGSPFNFLVQSTRGNSISVFSFMPWLSLIIIYFTTLTKWTKHRDLIFYACVYLFIHSIKAPNHAFPNFFFIFLFYILLSSNGKGIIKKQNE